MTQEDLFHMRRTLFFVILALFVLIASSHAQLRTPSDWRWRTDAPAQLVTGEDVPASAWRFVAMPPGWHVTTGPGTDNRARSR
jgi:hypothetical protein